MLCPPASLLQQLTCQSSCHIFLAFQGSRQATQKHQTMALNETDIFSLTPTDNDSLFGNLTNFTASPTNISEYVEDYRDSELYRQTKALYFYAYGVVMVSLCFLGAFGNILNLMVLARQRFRGATYIYLKWLAVADLAAMGLWMPEVARLGWYIGVDGLPWKFSAFYYAHISFPMINVALVTSSLLVVAVTVERYIAVCHPTKVHTTMSPRHVQFVIAVCYIVPLALFVPACFEYNVIEQDDGLYKKKWNAEYTESTAYQDVYKVIRVSLVRLLPVLVVLGLNFRTIREFRVIVKKRASLTQGMQQKTRRSHHEDLQRMILLAAVAVLYVVCMLPVAVYHVIVSAQLRDDFGFRLFAVFADLLDVSNSALNFYMYCLASKVFRRQFVLTFHCKTATVSTVSSGRNNSSAVYDSKL